MTLREAIWPTPAGVFAGHRLRLGGDHFKTWRGPPSHKQLFEVISPKSQSVTQSGALPKTPAGVGQIASLRVIPGWVEGSGFKVQGAGFRAACWMARACAQKAPVHARPRARARARARVVVVVVVDCCCGFRPGRARLWATAPLDLGFGV